MWKNNLERDRPQKAIWRMRIAFWMLKASKKHREYVTLTDFQRQQWLRERAPMSRYTYIAAFLAPK